MSTCQHVAFPSLTGPGRAVVNPEICPHGNHPIQKGVSAPEGQVVSRIHVLNPFFYSCLFHISDNISDNISYIYISYVCIYIYHIISYHIISYHIISYHIISYHIYIYHIYIHTYTSFIYIPFTSHVGVLFAQEVQNRRPLQTARLENLGWKLAPCEASGGTTAARCSVCCLFWLNELFDV